MKDSRFLLWSPGPKWSDKEQESSPRPSQTLLVEIWKVDSNGQEGGKKNVKYLFTAPYGKWSSGVSLKLQTNIPSEGTSAL